VGPWTVWWTRNLVADLLPSVQPVMASEWTRAAVVALGLVTFLAGLRELWHLFVRPTIGGATPSDFSTPPP
jgi:hypothetical protein